MLTLAQFFSLEHCSARNAPGAEPVAYTHIVERELFMVHSRSSSVVELDPFLFLEYLMNE